MANREVAAVHLVRGVLAGGADQPDQSVALELDEERRWWRLIDTATDRQLLATAVTSSDVILRSGNTINWRGRMITLNVDQDAALQDLMGATSRVRWALEGHQPRSDQPLPAPTMDPIGTPGRSASGGSGKQTAKRVESVAQFVETAMWVILALSVLGGLILALQTDSACDNYLADCSFWEARPLFGLGVGLAIVGVIQCSMIIMLAAYVRARADGSIE
jgi:hypothetical protein